MHLSLGFQDSSIYCVIEHVKQRAPIDRGQLHKSLIPTILHEIISSRKGVLKGSCKIPEATRNATIHIGRTHRNTVMRICFPAK